METLIGSLRADIQEIRRDFAVAIKELKMDILDIGQRVSDLEDAGDVRGNELELLRKEVISLPDQIIDLQSHSEDLENRSRRRNICIRVPSGAEGPDLWGYVTDLFLSSLNSPWS